VLAWALWALGMLTLAVIPGLVVAGATLAVAVVFQPARRRVQRAVDQRFNRRSYDAARTITAFSARLREETDLDTLSAELLEVVDQTMQPTQVWLWLRPSPKLTGTAASNSRAHAVSHQSEHDNGPAPRFVSRR
jgi:hypothetical protein